MTQDPIKRRQENQSYYRRNREREKARSQKWVLDNPEKVRAREKLRTARLGAEGLYLKAIRRKYGLSPERYYELLGEQNGLCALCGMANDGRKLHVDHIHVAGYDSMPHEAKAALVRGLLCAGCNVFLGHGQESVERVVSRAAAITSNVRAYLKR